MKLFGRKKEEKRKEELTREKKTQAKKSGRDPWITAVSEAAGLDYKQVKSCKLSAKDVRRVMEKTGWNPFETFCRMLKIATDKQTTFHDVFKERLWKDYRNECAERLYSQQPDETGFGAGIPYELFWNWFYSEEQQEAIAEIREHRINVHTIEKCFGLTIPEEYYAAKGEKTGFAFDINTIKEGDVFICVPDKYVVKDRLMRAKPCCIIGYPSYEEAIKETGIPFIPCRQLGSRVLDFAGFWKDSFDVKAVGITGSVGKTSTTDMIGKVVGSSRNMLKVEGNQNTTWQIANFVFRLKPSHEVYVQECSGSYPSQLEKSSRIVQPDIFVVTNVGNGHIDRYEGKQERLLHEKLAFDRHGHEDAIGIVNLDDVLLKSVVYHHKTISFAIKDRGADFVAESIRDQDGTITFTVVEKDGTRTDVKLNALGEHNVYNALAAFAVGVCLGIDRAVIADALEQYATKGARQNLVTYAGQKLYLDCCSATEVSMQSAMETLHSITVPEGHKKVAVLADVQALGDQTEDVHRRIGQMTADVNSADEIYFYGESMGYAMEEAEKRGLTCRHTTSRTELEKWIREETTPGDLIAFKAGHIMACQWIVDDLYGTNLYVHDKFTQNAPVIDEGDKQFKCIDEYGCALCAADKSLCGDSIPSEVNGYPVRVIDDGVYRNAKLERIVLPETVTSIADRAFYHCKGLSSVSFPAGLLYIGENAFAGCESLEEIDLSKGCVTIDENAFAGCNNLKKLYLPDNLKTIHESAFPEGIDLEIVCNSGTYAEGWAKDKS